jgi:hypothetical protein
MSKGIYEEYGKLPILFRKTTDFNGVPDIGLVYIGLLPENWTIQNERILLR